LDTYAHAKGAEATFSFPRSLGPRKATRVSITLCLSAVSKAAIVDPRPEKIVATTSARAIVVIYGGDRPTGPPRAVVGICTVARFAEVRTRGACHAKDVFNRRNVGTPAHRVGQVGDEDMFLHTSVENIASRGHIKCDVLTD